jgi:hypothetical protein
MGSMLPYIAAPWILWDRYINRGSSWEAYGNLRGCFKMAIGDEATFFVGHIYQRNLAHDQIRS